MNRALPLVALVLAGCNRYEPFLLAGYAQENFSNDADVLFVVDNSSSMQDEAAALAVNFDSFIGKLTDPSDGAATNDGLHDAVDNYIQYVNQRSAFVDYQLAITTTDVENTYGSLYGDDDTILVKGDADVGDHFRENLLCEATCFNQSTVPSDPDYACGDDNGGVVHRQYLDCICGADNWEDNCGSGQEEHLEAVFMAMCRAVENPPEECYTENQFTAADEGTNEGLLRESAAFIPILVTDEGDTSRRMAQGDGDPDEYEDLYENFQQRMSWFVIGPRTDVCNSGGATTWGVERYQYFVRTTNGRSFDIAEQDGTECVVTDFGTALEQLGDLLNNLIKTFTLAAVPDVDTILVFVDGVPVDRSEETENEETGEILYTDGWSYLAAENAVEFHGAAVPDYNSTVRIYYLPLEGMPKALPWE